MKFVIDAETDEILGAALLSVDAQELINTVALAMRHGITAAELRDAVYTHPSSTEAFNDVLATIVRTDERVTVQAHGIGDRRCVGAYSQARSAGIFRGSSCCAWPCSCSAKLARRDPCPKWRPSTLAVE